MTKALEKAFEAASRLSAREQDELAAAILEELDADERWEGRLRPISGCAGTLGR